jgi:protein ImuB
VQITEPVASLRLRVVAAEPLTDFQTELMETERTQHLKEMSVLIDGLSNHLGSEAVVRPALVADAQPEYACRFQSFIQTESSREKKRRDGSAASFPTGASKTQPRLPHQTPALRSNRPLRLWSKPRPIHVRSEGLELLPSRVRWAGKEYHISSAWGPERIETGWWRGDDIQRDYYVITTHLGTRYWIFRRHDDGRWFLHGCFD